MKSIPPLQVSVSSWDVITLSFKLLYERFPTWITLNFWYLLLSLPLITIPGMKAGLYQSVAASLRDPADTHRVGRKDLWKGFSAFKTKASIVWLIKWSSFGVIIFSIVFWMMRDSWILRSFSIISLYVLLLWLLTNNFLCPVMIENPKYTPQEIVRTAFLLAFHKPFETLFLMIVSNLLMLFGSILLGPVMLFVPVLRAILRTQMYWYLTGNTIPGFMDIVEYTNQYG